MGLPQLHDLQSPLAACPLNKLDDGVFYQFGKARDSVCVSVCVAQSEKMLKEDINWRSTGAEMTLTNSWIIKGAAWRRVEGGGRVGRWGGVQR